MNASQRLRMYRIAMAKSCPHASLATSTLSQARSASTRGRLSVCRTATALLAALAVDGALDGKQRVEAALDLDGDPRQWDVLLFRRLATRVLLDDGHGEERALAMDPTRRLPDRPFDGGRHGGPHGQDETRRSSSSDLAHGSTAFPTAD